MSAENHQEWAKQRRRRERRKFLSKKVHKLEGGELFVHPKIFQRSPPFAGCGKVSWGPPDDHRGAIHQNYLGIHQRGRAIPQSSWSYRSPGLCWELFRAVQFCWLLTHRLTPGTYSEPGDYLAAHSLLEKRYEILALTPCCCLEIQSSSVMHWRLIRDLWISKQASKKRCLLVHGENTHAHEETTPLRSGSLDISLY